jgi:hypothetical protein
MLLTKPCSYLQLRVLSGEMPALELVLASLKVLSLLALLLQMVLSLLALLSISPEMPLPALEQPQGAHFTCFTSTKVQILTPKYFLARLKGLLIHAATAAKSQLTCFTSTKVQILTLNEAQGSTAARGDCRRTSQSCRRGGGVTLWGGGRGEAQQGD